MEEDILNYLLPLSCFVGQSVYVHIVLVYSDVHIVLVHCDVHIVLVYCDLILFPMRQREN